MPLPNYLPKCDNSGKAILYGIVSASSFVGAIGSKSLPSEGPTADGFFGFFISTTFFSGVLSIKHMIREGQEARARWLQDMQQRQEEEDRNGLEGTIIGATNQQNPRPQPTAAELPEIASTTSGDTSLRPLSLCSDDMNPIIIIPSMMYSQSQPGRVVSNPNGEENQGRLPEMAV